MVKLLNILLKKQVRGTLFKIAPTINKHVIKLCNLFEIIYYAHLIQQQQDLA